MILALLALPCILILSLIFLKHEHTQKWLREALEKRWKQPARTVHTLAAAGALSGLMSCGIGGIALIIFPFAMVAAVKLVGRWGWLDNRLNYAQTGLPGMRRPLGLLYVAAAVPLLIGWPLFLFWMMVTSPLAFPIGTAYGYLRTKLGAPVPARAVDDFMLYVGIAIAILLYCGLVNRAFHRLTGIRSRALAWQFVGWTFLLMLCSSLLNRALGISNLPESEMFVPLQLTAIVTAYLLKQAGGVLGQWLARSSDGVCPEVGVTSTLPV